MLDEKGAPHEERILLKGVFLYKVKRSYHVESLCDVNAPHGEINKKKEDPNEDA